MFVFINWTSNKKSWGRNIIYIKSCRPSLCEDTNSKWLNSFMNIKKRLQGLPKSYMYIYIGVLIVG